MSALAHLIYSSRPVDFSVQVERDILFSARRHNERNGVTGALISRADIYLQLLEGAPAAVDETYRRIVADPRHGSVVLLLYEGIGKRLFADWSMRHDPVRCWMWSEPEVAAGDVERASARELMHAFKRIAAERS